MKFPFTETYIRMVEAALEVQPLRPRLQARMPMIPPHPGIGSIFAKRRERAWEGWEYRVLSWNPIVSQWVVADFDETEDAYFWIPRLDQLLGMLGGPDEFFGLLNMRDSWSLSPGREFYQFTDWHELALAVVMKEKHGKIWRQGKWEKA